MFKKKDKIPDKWPKATAGGFLIALGIVYGDIGTSPLYAMQAIVRGQGGLENVSQTFILGAVSLIVWTLTIITTIKYVIIALSADNHKEGGIFSLFTLVRRMRKWLIVPAMIGGAFLLADGALTPAVTVTSAIEGLKGVGSLSNVFANQTSVIIVTLVILAALFLIQRFGTGVVGRVFGPIMFLWFGFLGVSGLLNSFLDLSVFKAINPYYAIHLLLSSENKAGFFILGSIFLVTTGAEALYSDLGHVGRNNIYVSWPFVKICIILSYCGQGAWMMAHQGESLNGINPFFVILPKNLIIFAVILATFAAIIASQALISGSFTLVSEAIRLKLLPLFKIYYPGKSLGQLYIPAVNFVLWGVTTFLVLYFRTSEHMEAAYSLAITVTMLMTTTLLTYFLIQRGLPKLVTILGTTLLLVIEGSFFVASLIQFMNGAYIIVLLAILITFVMFVWVKGSKIVFNYVKRLNLEDYKGQLHALAHDPYVDMYQTNIVYLTNRMKGNMIDMSILYSILDKKPKRAEVYWFVNVKVTDTPYTSEYEVDMMGTDYIVKVTLYLGFRMRQDVPQYLRKIVKDLMESGRLPKQHQTYSINPGREVGDFGFIVIEERLNNIKNMSGFNRFILQTKLSIKKITTSPPRWFGLQFSEFTVEKVPLILSDIKEVGIIERKV